MYNHLNNFIKVNESLEGFFESKSGLLQGDPFSPYLYFLAMVVLTDTLKHDLTTNNLFSYHWHTKDL